MTGETAERCKKIYDKFNRFVYDYGLLDIHESSARKEFLLGTFIKHNIVEILFALNIHQMFKLTLFMMNKCDCASNDYPNGTVMVFDDGKCEYKRYKIWFYNNTHRLCLVVCDKEPFVEFFIKTTLNDIINKNPNKEVINRIKDKSYSLALLSALKEAADLKFPNWMMTVNIMNVNRHYPIVPVK